MNVYSEQKVAANGQTYSVRYLLSEEEYNHYKDIGLIAKDSELVIGLFEINLEDWENDG